MSDAESKKYPPRVFSGVQPSGAQVHVGNYLGAMKQFVSLAREFETIVCIVDLHALTSVESREDLVKYSQSLAAAYVAIGLDPEKTIIFRQSDVPEVCELCWYFACQFPLGLLERSHALKDARAKGQSVNSGLMFYPILMAADILLYRATIVPVGADQKQHLEMTRDLVQRFNHRFGDVLPIPEALISKDTGVIPGLDGQKMSKSYDNYIGLFESPKSAKKKIMKIVTDSKTVEEKKDPDSCSVFALFNFFANDDERAELRQRYTQGGMGYGEAKQELVRVFEREISPLRDTYEQWIAKPDDLQDLLADGAKRARVIAQQTIGDVREAIGVGKYL